MDKNIIDFDQIFGSEIRVLSVVSFSAGMASTNYIVETSNGNFVVKSDNRNEAQHKLDQLAREYAVQAGLHIPATYAVGPGPLSVCKFVDGVPFAYSRSNIEQIAQALSKIHQIQPAPFSRHSVYKRYHECMKVSRDVEEIHSLDEFNFSSRLAQVDETMLARILQATCLTHGDFKPDNFVDQTVKIQILDWEKSCSCSKEMDLVLALMFMGTSENFSPSWVKCFIDSYKKDAAILLDDELMDISLNLVPYIFALRDGGLAILYNHKQRIQYAEEYAIPVFKRWHYRDLDNLVRKSLK